MSSRRRLRESPRLVIAAVSLALLLVAVGVGVALGVGGGSSKTTRTTTVMMHTTATRTTSVHGAVGDPAALRHQLRLTRGHLTIARDELGEARRRLHVATRVARCWRRAAAHHHAHATCSGTATKHPHH